MIFNKKVPFKRVFKKISFVLLALIISFSGTAATTQATASAAALLNQLSYLQKLKYVFEKLNNEYKASIYSTPDDLIRSFERLEHEFHDITSGFLKLQNEVNAGKYSDDISGLYNELSEFYKILMSIKLNLKQN